jgi:hypothetical protein
MSDADADATAVSAFPRPDEWTVWLLLLLLLLLLSRALPKVIQLPLGCSARHYWKEWHWRLCL